jgi:polyisoprenoid-binding protein YceI
MKQLIIILCAVISLTANAQKILTPIDNTKSVTFKIKNLGINVDGNLTGLKGKIVFDEKKLTTSYFDVTVSSATINTGIDARDKHLKKTDYFDVVKYPTLSIKSSQITAKGNGVFTMTGTITIKATSKPFSIDFKPTLLKDNSVNFTSEFSIKRRTFDIGGKSFTLSDNLIVKLNVIAK